MPLGFLLKNDSLGRGNIVLDSPDPADLHEDPVGEAFSTIAKDNQKKEGTKETPKGDEAQEIQSFRKVHFYHKIH